MRAQDQPSTGEKSPETRFDLTPSLEQRQEFVTSTQTDTTSNQFKVQDNNIVVPPLFTNTKMKGTTGDTSSPKYLEMTSPYDSWGLASSSGNRTDLAHMIRSIETGSQPGSDTVAKTVFDTSSGALTLAQVDARPAEIKPPSSPEAPAPADVAPGNDGTKPARNSLSASDVHNQKILEASKSVLDQKVWKGSQFERAVGKGKYGGAASVSVILQNQGYDYAKSASVSQLTNSMIARGWQLVGVNDAKPGDIIFGGKTGTNWRNGGGNGRVGIVGEDGKVHHNNSQTGKWSVSDKQQVFGKEFGDQVWILRPPAEGPQGRPVTREVPHNDNGVDRRRGRNRNYEQPQRQPTNRSEDPNNRDYRDFRGRQNWAGRDEGRYPPQFNESSNILNLKDFNPIEIVKNAIDGLGKALWSLTPFKHSVRNGRLGCAASVSEVLQRSGYDYANHAGVGGLESQLMRNGWQKAPLSSADAGDVVVVGRSRGWRAGGGAAHVGIVGENGSVYHNNSARGQWVRDNLHARFGRGVENFVLKPPTSGAHKIDPRMFTHLNPEPDVNPAPRPAYHNQGESSRHANRRESRGYDSRNYDNEDQSERRGRRHRRSGRH